MQRYRYLTQKRKPIQWCTYNGCNNIASPGDEKGQCGKIHLSKYNAIDRIRERLQQQSIDENTFIMTPVQRQREEVLTRALQTPVGLQRIADALRPGVAEAGRVLGEAVRRMNEQE